MLNEPLASVVAVASTTVTASAGAVPRESTMSTGGSASQVIFVVDQVSVTGLPAGRPEAEIVTGVPVTPSRGVTFSGLTLELGFAAGATGPGGAGTPGIAGAGS